MNDRLDNFNTDRQQSIENWDNELKLIKKYMTNTPIVNPIWNLTENSLQYVDINIEITSAGIILFIAPFNDVWNGLFEPFPYDKDTLWKKNYHDRDKILRVIQHWEKQTPLSPIFLSKHINFDLGLVLDGKHRLTVARFMDAQCIPFMVPVDNSAWISRAIPSATKIQYFLN